MPGLDNHQETALVVDPVEDAVISNADTIGVRFATQLLYSRALPWIPGQLADRPGEASLNVTRKTK